MSLRAAFLIVAAAIVLRVPFGATLIVLIGYAICTWLDQWMYDRAKDKALESEMHGWEPDPDDPDWENNNGLSRRKLTGESQLVVTRISEIIRRMPGVP